MNPLEWMQLALNTIRRSLRNLQIMTIESGFSADIKVLELGIVGLDLYFSLLNVLIIDEY